MSIQALSILASPRVAKTVVESADVVTSVITVIEEVERQLAGVDGKMKKATALSAITSIVASSHMPGKEWLLANPGILDAIIEAIIAASKNEIFVNMKQGCISCCK